MLILDMVLWDIMFSSLFVKIWHVTKRNTDKTTLFSVKCDLRF